MILKKAEKLSVFTDLENLNFIFGRKNSYFLAFQYVEKLATLVYFMIFFRRKNSMFFCFVCFTWCKIPEKVAE